MFTKSGWSSRATVHVALIRSGESLPFSWAVVVIVVLVGEAPIPAENGVTLPRILAASAMTASAASDGGRNHVGERSAVVAVVVVSVFAANAWPAPASSIHARRHAPSSRKTRPYGQPYVLSVQLLSLPFGASLSVLSARCWVSKRTRWRMVCPSTRSSARVINGATRSAFQLAISRSFAAVAAWSWIVEDMLCERGDVAQSTSRGGRVDVDKPSRGGRRG